MQLSADGTYSSIAASETITRVKSRATSSVDLRLLQELSAVRSGMRSNVCANDFPHVTCFVKSRRRLIFASNKSDRDSIIYIKLGTSSAT